MKVLLWILFCLVTFIFAWLALYQIARIIIAMVPATRALTLVAVTAASMVIAWAVIRDSQD